MTSTNEPSLLVRLCRIHPCIMQALQAKHLATCVKIRCICQRRDVYEYNNLPYREVRAVPARPCTINGLHASPRAVPSSRRCSAQGRTAPTHLEPVTPPRYLSSAFYDLSTIPMSAPPRCGRPYHNRRVFSK